MPPMLRRTVIMTISFLQFPFLGSVRTDPLNVKPTIRPVVMIDEVAHFLSGEAHSV